MIVIVSERKGAALSFKRKKAVQRKLAFVAVKAAISKSSNNADHRSRAASEAGLAVRMAHR